MAHSQDHTTFVKTLAHELGFMNCGIAVAKELTEDAHRLEYWLEHNYHAGMEYMARNFDLRINPQKLVPGAQSVITLLYNYYPEQQQLVQAPKVAKYAYGKDYHLVIKDKLHLFLARLRAQVGEVEGRGFVDSAPVLERSWAVNSGLGWIGKNGNLIHKKAGSFFFIATLITDLVLEPDAPFKTHHCGSCTACIDACPTQAILSPTVIDANKCISYLTIELKDMVLPQEQAKQLDGWMFGCDVCQDVCPWNRFASPHQEPAFKPIPQLLNITLGEWEAMSEEVFKELFRESPLKRSKYAGIQRNIKALRS